MEQTSLRKESEARDYTECCTGFPRGSKVKRGARQRIEIGDIITQAFSTLPGCLVCEAKFDMGHF